MRKHRIAFFSVALAGALLDLLSKHLAFSNVPGRPNTGREVTVIEGLFSFGKTTNTGIIFGWGQEWGTIFLVVSIAAVPLITFLYLRWKLPTWTVSVALGLILAGTLGNLYDRLMDGAVRDFIKFYLIADGMEKTFPLFNLADSCICVGVGILSVEMMCFDDGGKKRKKRKTQAPLPAAETEPVPLMNVPEAGPTERAPAVSDDTAAMPRLEEHPPDETKDASAGS
ncbi:MAG: signal peptidase II [Planctomycetota bacterium]|jgi:signal peptidase II